MNDSISIQEARKLALLSQKLPSAKQIGTAISATQNVIEHLGYIQIDTISVVQRAHLHTLWNRNPRYKACQLDQLLIDKKVFEYWSHAAAYLPFRDYRFSLPRKVAFVNGDLKHWYKRDETMIRMVLKRITEEGPLMAKDFENSGKSSSQWKTKSAKQALEYLFMQGDLMVPCRVNFHKVYDLTERVIPEYIDTTTPDMEEYTRFLVTRYLSANGLGQASEISYLLSKTKPFIKAALEDMVSSGELLKIYVAGKLYYALSSYTDLLSKPLARSKLKILSPFDNFVIQRNRMRSLFGYDYQIECYVPESKRRYGYFSLPILWDGRLVARMDCKAKRKESLLHIHYLELEPMCLKTDALLLALRDELGRFLTFNNCNKIRLHKTYPAKIKHELQRLINDLSI